MAGKQCADILFCIDASGSMKHTFIEVCQNIHCLIEGMQSSGQMAWDIRFDFISFSSGNGMHAFSSVNCNGMDLINAIYHPASSQYSGQLFTHDPERFKAALGHVKVYGEEAHLIALDCALDFPWREASECHRVVVLLTDEPVETGVNVPEQLSQVSDMIEKLHQKRIKLFIIAPESDALYDLSSADRSEYDVIDGYQNGLSNVNFSKMLAAIGKSVSVSQTSLGGTSTPMPLFEQDRWVATQGELGEDNAKSFQQ